MKTTGIIFLMLIIVSTAYSQSRISDALLGDIQKAQANGTTVEAIIVLHDQFNTAALDQQLTLQKATAHERGVAVVNALMTQAENTQTELVSFLESRLITDVIRYQRFWITNVILVEAMPAFLYELAQRQDIALLDQNTKIEEVEPVSMQPATVIQGHTEPGLKAINADKMWQLGFTGEGVIVGALERGVEGSHPALINSWHGNSVPASQAWYDPQYGTTFPVDPNGHGTHVMGTIAGLDSMNTDTVGVAFGSEWICARMVNYTYSEELDRLQWMVNPDGDPGTTSDMPAVVNNSWGNTINGPCTPTYISAILNLETAGIAAVFAAGNNGPGASTILDPAKSNYNALQIFSVGAVDGNFENLPIATWSSRGPTTCSLGGDQIKPEVTAPGVAVCSSFLGGTYRYGWGTSMAVPHVSGAIALLKQAFPDKTGNEIKQMLFETARDLGVAGADNTYGNGIIDVYQAYIENAFPGNPRPPDNVIAYSDFTTPAEVTITWSDPSRLVNGDTLINFEILIYRDGALIANLLPGVGLFTDSGLNNSQHYDYAVKTHDLITGNMSIDRIAQAFAGGSKTPAPPSNVKGEYQPSSNSILIQWTDPITQSDGTPIDDLGMISIYREQVLIGTVFPGICKYLDTPTPYEQTFTYKLQASDNETPVNYSDFSEEVDVFGGEKPNILVYYGTASGPVIGYADSVYRTIRSFNIPVHKTDDLAEFGSLLSYRAVFVVTGMLVPYDHFIYNDDAAVLLEFLNNGGRIYIEGNACFNYLKGSGWTVFDIRPWLGLGPGDWTVEAVDGLTGLNELSDLNSSIPAKAIYGISSILLLQPAPFGKTR